MENGLETIRRYHLKTIFSNYILTQTISGPKMSGNFVRERQRIVYIYNIHMYVKNTMYVTLLCMYVCIYVCYICKPLAHEISRHFWAAYAQTSQNYFTEIFKFFEVCFQCIVFFCKKKSIAIVLLILSFCRRVYPAPNTFDQSLEILQSVKVLKLRKYFLCLCTNTK